MRRLLLAALLALALPAAATAQISPGPLARAHQSLEGATQCTKCHGSSAAAMPQLCLSCHKEISWLMAQGRGLHAREGKAPGKSCASCHPDHAGRDFQLVAWPAGGMTRFDHRAAGWTLEGKHAKAACEKCHRSEFRIGPAATISTRKSSAGWVGLESSCVSCHRRDDPHQNSLGPECQRCHDAAGWTPAPKFDHAASRYPLTGKHADVACAKCHLAASLALPVGTDGKRIARFRPLPFAECSSCHSDPHRGQLSAECSSCHVTQGFAVINRQEFNHGATRYPLLGKHRSVTCDACHGRAMARPKPAFAACASCHADAHAGEATLAGAPADCAACHRVDGFAPSTFTIAQHQTTKYPLGGKHQAVLCAKCHTSSAAPGSAKRVVRLRASTTSCASCHADPHGAQPASQICSQCHGDAGWGVIRYAQTAHASTRLPLEGAHAALTCASCHGPKRPGLPAFAVTTSLGKAGVMFRIPEVRCATCHTDPHRTVGIAVRPDTGAGCANCHNSASFRPATIGIAAHAKYSLPLEGAHRAVPCIACHTGLPTSARVSGQGATLIGALRPVGTIGLKAVKGTTCAACHQTPHGTQFASRPDAGRCDACHGTGVFTTSPAFNHDRDAAFPLAGAHTRVLCATCHRTDTTSGVAQVVYRPLPHRCEDCHTAKPSKGGT